MNPELAKKKEAEIAKKKLLKKRYNVLLSLLIVVSLFICFRHSVPAGLSGIVVGAIGLYLNNKKATRKEINPGEWGI